MVNEEAPARKRKVGKRLRFEILKRDGFACRYCGASAVADVLHVDHVVPIAEGGSNEPHNLVTACAPCNGGKGAVPLDRSRISPRKSAEDLREQAEQIRAYTDAAMALVDARQHLYDRLCDIWREEVGCDPLMSWYKQLPRLTQAVPVEVLITAIKAVGARQARGYISDINMAKYFGGCVRKVMEGSQ